jgi:hypothetical protein
MFQKMYTDEPDNWQPIEEAQVTKELGACYRNVSEVLTCLRQGGQARTPFAFYRWVLELPARPSPYGDYFRRGLITADEWARLESARVCG